MRSIPVSSSLDVKDTTANGDNKKWPFRQVMGRLMLIANQARPDMMDASRAIARYSHDPKPGTGNPRRRPWLA